MVPEEMKEYIVTYSAQITVHVKSTRNNAAHDGRAIMNRHTDDFMNIDHWSAKVLLVDESRPYILNTWEERI